MTYFVRIIARSNAQRLSGPLYGFDMTDQQLRDQVMEPFERGAPITLKRRTLSRDDIAEITVRRARDHVDDDLLAQLQEAFGRSRESVDEWLRENTTDVTDDYVDSGEAAHRHPEPGDKPEMPIWLSAALAAAGLIGTVAVFDGASAWFIAAGIGLIASMAILHRRIWRSKPVWWAVLAVAGCTAVPAVAAYLIVESDAAGEVPGPTASITTPEDGASVSYRTLVEGTSEGIPLNSRPWLFVYSNDGEFYPQGGEEGEGVEIDPSDGSWCRAVWFGEASRSATGNGYSLILALPTPEADQKLEYLMNPFLQLGAQVDLPRRVVHLPRLPKGFEVLAPVRKVKRLPYAEINATADCR
ncbi:MAG: hypothetical protein WBL45_01430 [Solirubrobacterales bacterium]